MRGEHYNAVRLACSPQGSSPHARGTRTSRWMAIPSRGIIPACAGNTATLKAMLDTLGDHPRMRGEHSHGVKEHEHVEGSSPHARGTLCAGWFRCGWLGIIPACAGNTGFVRCRASRLWDHPRMRGEHRVDGFRRSRPVGSSPHARGTPALSRAWLQPAGDHPRMRGEHRMRLFSEGHPRGSSPHARGTL